MESVIEGEKKQIEEEIVKERAVKDNMMRKNMYAKYVQEMNLPKIEEGGALPVIDRSPLPNRFTSRNHQRNRSMILASGINHQSPSSGVITTHR
jgi:hypothetical protein